MVAITRELLRRKAEHNEGTLDDLEEIALHQLEIERIEVVGSCCRRLKILYLQNNIIGKMENLHHLKELEYLNLAMNNIRKIEGLESCEFLQKLDLLVNFIPCSALEESMRNLQKNKMLRELYVMGNPFTDWKGHKDYIINMLPWLEKLEGEEITKAQRIRAAQRFEGLKSELKDSVSQICPTEEVSGDDEQNAPYTPELRTEMYREIAEQKAEKETREKERLPKERNYEREHAEAVQSARTKQFFEDGRVRQCNEANLDFSFEEDEEHFYLMVKLPRYVDSSLTNCEVFPKFVEVVFKDKILRLCLPASDCAEVLSDRSKCERSKTTGELKVTMVKSTPTSLLSLAPPGSTCFKKGGKKTESMPSRVRRLDSAGRQKKADEMLQEAVDLKRIYTGKENPNAETSSEQSLLQIHSQTNFAKKRQLETEKVLAVPPLDDED